MSPFISFRNAVIAFAFLAIAVFALALSCQRPAPTPAALSHAHAVTTQAVAVKDSVVARVKIRHAQSSIRIKRLAPLRERVSITPSAVLVDGHDTLTGPGVGVIGKVIASQDTVIDALQAENAVKDTALVASESALQASLHETVVARSFIPSRWQRVKTAGKWITVGLIAGAVTHAVLVR